MKKSLIQKLGLLGVVSFLSYTAAVVFAPLAYPGDHWMAQEALAYGLIDKMIDKR